MGLRRLDSVMSDRSDEATRARDDRSTDELLEETDRLLSESGASVDDAVGAESDRDGLDAEAGAAESFGRGSIDAGTGSVDGSSGAGSIDATEGEESAGRWSLSRLLPSMRPPSRSDASSTTNGVATRLSPSRYFSPKSFLAIGLAVAAGTFVGSLVLPMFGGVGGMLAVAFGVGLLAARRRYLEVILAAAPIGAAAAVVNDPVIAVAGSGRAVLAVGAATGLVACLVGYYFGRDLRDGLFRDIE